MSDEPIGAGPAEGTAPEAPAPSTPEPWAPVLDRMSELAGTLDSRFAALEQRIPQPEAEPEPDPWAALAPEAEEPQYFDAYGNPVELQQPQQQPGLDINALQQAVAQMQQQAVAPLQAQLQQLMQERARDQLYTNIPQLKDPEVANQAIQNITQGLAAAQAPPEIAQWVSNNPWMIEQLFKAAEAEKLAAGQAPASEAVPALEAAGGAVPGGDGSQPNIVHQVMANRRSGLPSGFGGR